MPTYSYHPHNLLQQITPHPIPRRLLEVLDTYKPFVWEYSRLNITNTVMSKRKLNKLVTGGYVKGWDDPRLLTLAGESGQQGQQGC